MRQKYIDATKELKEILNGRKGALVVREEMFNNSSVACAIQCLQGHGESVQRWWIGRFDDMSQWTRKVILETFYTENIVWKSTDFHRRVVGDTERARSHHFHTRLCAL